MNSLCHKKLGRIAGFISLGFLLFLIAGYWAFTNFRGVEFAGIKTHRAGPAYLYPDPILTPGLIATTDYKELTAIKSCGTYSQCHRKTTEAIKKKVCEEYPKNCTGTQEIDHDLPIALGGADDTKNLWAQPEKNVWNDEDWGFHKKDKLESYLVSQMKAGTITPKDAQDCILKDWVSCYRKNLGNKFGSIELVKDPDDFD